MIALVLAAGIFLGAGSRNVQAAVGKNVTSPGAACKDGNYIYYAYEMGGIRMGIMRLNPKTGAKKEIYSYKYKGKGSNGFYDLTVKGDYVYATWDQGYGSSPYNPYIYKIRKDGKGSKKLAVGNCPVVIGNYVYYVEYQKTQEEWWKKTGYISRMKLDGSGKKKVLYVGNQLDRLYTDGSRLLYDKYNSPCLYTSSGETVYTSNLNIVKDMGTDTVVTTVGNYQYYYYKVGYKKTAIYRKNVKTGKTARVANFPAGISSFRVVGDYLMVRASIQDGKYYSIYCISADGKKKNRLVSWRPAE